MYPTGRYYNYNHEEMTDMTTDPLKDTYDAAQEAKRREDIATANAKRVVEETQQALDSGSCPSGELLDNITAAQEELGAAAQRTRDALGAHLEAMVKHGQINGRQSGES